MNEETQLIQQLKSKNEDAFLEVVNMYKKKIVALCYSYTIDSFEAEDLSQEVFISLYKSIDNFRGESSLSTYIYKIAVSKCLDYKRKRSIKSFLAGLISYGAASNSEYEEKSFIQAIINGLNRDLKAAVVLYYYVGLNHKEIAEVLQTTSRAVEGKIYRAKQILKNELEKEGYGICTQKRTI